MIRATSPARSVMRALRTGLSQPPGSDLTPLLPLARQALAFIDRGAAEDPATVSDASELAFLLAALLEAGNEAFRRQAFGLLFRLGVEGEVLAVIHLEKMPEDAALGILAGLREEEQLLFANAFFRRPRFDRPKTAAFCLAMLDAAVEKNPDEILILLDLLANRQEYPALPLRNALVRGRLGLWLRRLLQMTLTAEQTRYMARVAGRLRDPGLTEKLAASLADIDEVSAELICHALGATPGLDQAVVVPPLRTLLATATEPSLLTAAFQALARCDEVQAASTAAALLAGPADIMATLAPVIAGFSLPGFGTCLRSLPPAGRQNILLAVYAFLATAMPLRIRTATRIVLATGKHPAALGAAVFDDLDQRTAPDQSAPQPAPAQPAAASGASPEKSGGLWNRVKTLVGAPGDQADAATTALRQELAAGGEVRERQILWKTLDGLEAAGLSLVHCNFKASSLFQAQLTEVALTDCQLTDVNLELVRLCRVSFSRCRFTNCRFSQADFETVHFTDCELRLCTFEGITARDLALTGVDAAECDFCLATLIDCTWSQVCFRAVSLVRAQTQALAIRGGLFADCLFERALMPEAVLASVRTEGCYFAGSRLSGQSDEPNILDAMAKAEAHDLQRTATEGTILPLPAALTTAQGVRLVAAIVDAVLFARDVRRRRLGMLANNKRRLAWARRRLGPEQAAWLDMLPGLVQAGWTKRGQSCQPAPPARVSGYIPDLATTRHLATVSGLPPTAVLDTPDDALVVESIVTVGSTGTVAQTEDAALTIWLCLEEVSADRPDRHAFADKLDAIRHEAAQAYGLELHFVVTTARTLRDNRFDADDSDGRGSAQGCLRKEEWYRTALVLAGKKPAWWFVPPHSTTEGYAKTMAGLRHAAPDTAADSLDFGCVHALADEAFFGASLWMIVNSLTTPFTSIIKLGLLEKYAAEAGTPVLLCETLKESIFTNQGGLWRCDPYALLFHEVSQHYRQHGSSGILELLRQAFLQKTGFDPCEDYRNRAGEAILDYFFPYAAPAGGTYPPPKREAPERAGDFSQMLTLGDAITTYLMRAYERLKQRATGSSGLSQRDQTMLSRRIAATFARRVGKIMRLPFIRPEHSLVAALEITYENVRPKENEMVFSACIETPGADRKSRTRERLRQETSLVSLAAWLVANEFHRPGLFLQATNLPAPLTSPDVSGLLDAIQAAFPMPQTVAPPLARGLEPEQVTAALVVCNLLTPREERENRCVNVLYATSWGELFHLERTTDLDTLDDSPATLLTAGLGLHLAPTASVTVFAPKRSQCRAARMARRQ